MVARSSHQNRTMVLRTHRRIAVLLSVAALVLVVTGTLAGCATGPASAGGGVGTTSIDGAVMSTAQPLTADCVGVRVIVDFGILDASPISECVDIDANSSAVDVLADAGVTLTGTADYGDAVVCRVNDLPNAIAPVQVDGHDPFTETCASMPPEFAYWALWVKQGSPDWGYALVGVTDLVLNPGESIGLVFTTGTSTPTPS